MANNKQIREKSVRVSIVEFYDDGTTPEQKLTLHKYPGKKCNFLYEVVQPSKLTPAQTKLLKAFVNSL